MTLIEMEVAIDKSSDSHSILTVNFPAASFLYLRLHLYYGIAGYTHIYLLTFDLNFSKDYI